MSYYAPPRRPVRRRRDNTPIIVAALALIGIPGLSFAVYKLVIDKPPPAPAEVAVVDDSRFKPTSRGPTYREDALPPSPAMASNDFQFDANSYAPSDGAASTTPDSQFAFNGSGMSFTPGMYSGGSGGGNSINVSGAVTKVGEKIKESLETGKSLVIWLVDRTPSCETRRQEVARQLETLYPTLVKDADKSAKPEDAPLLTAVCSFAADVQYATDEPTADVSAIRSALGGIQNDAGNIENTFKAIETVVGQYASFTDPPHRRYLTVVVVTDEVGNDQAERDRVAEVLKRHQAYLYVIGQGAAFGSTGTTQAGAEGAGGQVTGPESHDVEWISLDAPGGMGIGGPTGQDSGVGPYGLTYLCKQTGGEFFATGGYGMGVSLPPKYLPTYMSEKDYQAQVGSNKAMAALFEAARMKHAQQISGPRTSFEVDENGLAVVRDIDLAQRPVALILPDINNLYDTLKRGEGDRAKLTEPRQQAAFDLAIGRAMAAKVRAEGYIVLMAAFKAGRKTSSGAAGLWSLYPAEGIEKNSVLDGMAKKARAYLEGVVKDHPGTPWAQAAQQELSMPIGWEWREG